MNESEAKDILERISVVYSRFEITEMVIEVWLGHLKTMHYDKVLYRLNEHIAENKFPPTIAEIAAYPKKENEFLKKVERWKEESLYAQKHRR